MHDFNTLEDVDQAFQDGWLTHAQWRHTRSVYVAPPFRLHAQSFVRLLRALKMPGETFTRRTLTEWLDCSGDTAEKTLEHLLQADLVKRDRRHPDDYRVRQFRFTNRHMPQFLGTAAIIQVLRDAYEPMTVGHIMELTRHRSDKEAALSRQLRRFAKKGWVKNINDNKPPALWVYNLDV